MTQSEVEIALERYRNEIGSLKHRMDEVQRIVDAVHSLAQQMVAQTSEIKHAGAGGWGSEKGCGGVEGKAGSRWRA